MSPHMRKIINSTEIVPVLVAASVEPSGVGILMAETATLLYDIGVPAEPRYVHLQGAKCLGHLNDDIRTSASNAVSQERRRKYTDAFRCPIITHHVSLP